MVRHWGLCSFEERADVGHATRWMFERGTLHALAAAAGATAMQGRAMGRVRATIIVDNVSLGECERLVYQPRLRYF